MRDIKNKKCHHFGSDDFEICLMKLDSENSALSSLLIGYLPGDKIQGEFPSYLNLKCV